MSARRTGKVNAPQLGIKKGKCSKVVLARVESSFGVTPADNVDIVLRPAVPGIKDSGERREFDTGAVRDRGTLKGRPDLRAVHALHRYDLHNEKGAAKYAARNWEKGMPLSEYYNSAARHAEKMLAGYADEDHEAAWIWNVMHFVETRERIVMGLLPEELDDMPQTCAGREPRF